MQSLGTLLWPWITARMPTRVLYIQWSIKGYGVMMFAPITKLNVANLYGAVRSYGAAAKHGEISDMSVVADGNQIGMVEPIGAVCDHYSMTDPGSHKTPHESQRACAREGNYMPKIECIVECRE